MHRSELTLKVDVDTIEAVLVDERGDALGERRGVLVVGHDVVCGQLNSVCNNPPSAPKVDTITAMPALWYESRIDWRCESERPAQTDAAYE